MRKVLLMFLSLMVILSFSFGKDKEKDNQNVAAEFTFGPAFGFGDVFKEYSGELSPYYSYYAQNKLGFHFGFGARYYLKENLAIQGAVDFQHVSADWEESYSGLKSSGSEGWRINKFFINGVYDLSLSGKINLTPFIFAGLGIGSLGGYAFEKYEVEPETKFGINVGAGLRYALTEDIGLIGHLVFTDIFTEDCEF